MTQTTFEDDFYIYQKGKAFTNFLESIDKGFCEYDNPDKLNMNTKCIIEYTSLLLDRIHFRENSTIGFYMTFPKCFYLINRDNPSDEIYDLLPYIIPEQSVEFIWQMYLLTNSEKILYDINDFVADYGDLLWMYSDEYLNTFKWEPNINDFIKPKVLLENNYARVECCWIEGNEIGLYKEVCEYNILDDKVLLINEQTTRLLPPWGAEDDDNTSDDNESFSDDEVPF